MRCLLISITIIMIIISSSLRVESYQVEKRIKNVENGIIEVKSYQGESNRILSQTMTRQMLKAEFDFNPKQFFGMGGELLSLEILASIANEYKWDKINYNLK